MESLLRLEQSLLEENQEGVKSYLDEIDRKTANELMTKAGEALGFTTIDIHGIVYTHMGMLSQVFGYADVSGLWKLVEAYQLSSAKIGWFGDEGKTKLRKTFNLSPKDSHATFVTWDTFLVAGMHGQSPEAKKVKVYLLKAERGFRIGMAVVDHLKIEEQTLKNKLLKIKVAKETLSLMSETGLTVPESIKKKITGVAIPEDIQMSFDFNP